MKNTREKAIEWIIEAEGGYVNNPNDPGGETKYGISKKVYPNLDIKNLTKEQAAEIYIRDYWNKIKGDDLPFPLDICVFDFAVNSGISRAVKILQSEIGAVTDGIVGNDTLSHLASLNYDWKEFLLRRLEFYISLKTFKYFGRGWCNRLINLRYFIEKIYETKTI